MIKIKDLCIAYGKTVVVSGFTLSIQKGEFFTLLGPSGCGKSTVLRTIAGFVPAMSGSIEINGKDVTQQSAEERNVGIVFQNYALFPHMTVFENVAFGMRVAGHRRALIQEKVNAMLERTGILSHAHKKPEALSGGQQQRVAIARSLIIGTRILLLDEPLSNLDVRIRESMRREIKRLQRELGFTAIYVTHDQEEALALSDRLVVMSEGAIHQVGTGPELYQRPASSFVCQFVGDAIRIPDGLIKDVMPTLADKTITHEFYIRPEDVHLTPTDAAVRFKGLVNDVYYLGVLTKIDVSIGDATLACVTRSSNATATLSRGTEVSLGFSPCALHQYPRAAK